MFVVDASITLAWCFEDETTQGTEALLRRLLTEGGAAPAHWPLEVANGLVVAERRRRLDEQKLIVARSVLTSLPIDVASMDLETALGVIDAARSESLTAYDAAYIDLALSRRLGLATIDERLAAACRTVGVPLID
jgi:predicted nucleic acid-binding protein